MNIDMEYDPTYGYKIPYSRRVSEELHGFTCTLGNENVSSEVKGIIHVIRK